MIESITKLGVLGFLAVAVVLTACFAVVFAIVHGTDTETSKTFATALAGPGLGGILVAIGAAFGGGSKTGS